MTCLRAAKGEALGISNMLSTYCVPQPIKTDTEHLLRAIYDQNRLST